MKRLFSFVFLLFAIPASAQVTPGKLSFALPEHPGSLSFDQGNFKITELSAKPNGGEFGIRANDGDLHFLGFLFLVPEKPHLTSSTCREEMIRHDGATAIAATKERSVMKSDSGADIAIALMVPPSGKFSTLRAFVAKDALCADLSFTMAEPITTAQLPLVRIKAILGGLIFNPEAKPTFRDAFAYATVAWDHHDLRGAAFAYRSALNLVDSSEDPLKWRRVTTDQLSMALGMAGELKKSRNVNEAAILIDPTYPLYYFNLACADAEEGNATAARTHLQQAYDRKANTLPGERLPDPTEDDSILKLKSDTNFWEFAKTLHP